MIRLDSFFATHFFMPTEKTIKFRNTVLRKEIVDIFNKLTMPLTVVELKELLARKNYFPNKSTLYRQIKSLVKQKILEEVIIDSETAYYEKVTSLHPHFSCEKCHRISCISDIDQDMVSQFKELLGKRGYTLAGYQFVLYGWCRHCR